MTDRKPFRVIYDVLVGSTVSIVGFRGEGRVVGQLQVSAATNVALGVLNSLENEGYLISRATRLLLCSFCDAAFDRPHHRGPKPKYCSAACRQAAHRSRHELVQQADR